MGERYVRLLHVTPDEMEEQVRLGTLAIPGAAEKMRNRLIMRQQQQQQQYAYIGIPLHQFSFQPAATYVAQVGSDATTSTTATTAGMATGTSHANGVYIDSRNIVLRQAYSQANMHQQQQLPQW